MTQHTDIEVRDSVRIDSDVDTVFRYLTDAEKLVKWWPVTATSEARAGGELHFGWQSGSITSTRFATFEPGRGVAFEFGPEYVELSIAPIDGGCIVSVRHLRIAVADGSFDLPIHIAQSWTFLLLNLKSVIEHGIDLRPSWM